MDTKICAKCKIEKPKSDYHLRSAKKSGCQSRCKSCTAEYRKDRYYKNRDEELERLTISRNKPENKQQRKGYYLANKEAYSNRYKKYMEDPDKAKRKKEYSTNHYNSNIEKRRSQIREYEKTESARERRKIIHKEKKENDPQYNIKRRLRFRLRNLVKAGSTKKYKSSNILIGCEVSFFKNHLESLFTDGMNWAEFNAGNIHIDHIKPCVEFDLTDPRQQKECFHYTNLQPLWALDNIKKGCRYDV